MPQFERAASMPQEEVAEHMGGYYSHTVWMVPITDSAQADSSNIIAWVPETQVLSLLAHLNDE